MTNVKLKILAVSVFILVQTGFVYGSSSSPIKTVSDQKESSSPVKQNRLANESSPYLLQHATNPVDWYPWGKEAFDKAKSEDKMVFLSIGYSTCHWCHVMERESFSNKDVAGLLNKYFVSVKVDREERPDIDKVYMTVTQMMTGRGGWPMTVILTPDKMPFYAGTYFPKTERWGQPGLMQLLPALQDAWVNRRQEILENANLIVRALKQQGEQNAETGLDKSILDTAKTVLEQRFDAVHGGFGTAPKFPMPHYLSFLLRQYYRTGDVTALEMVEKTLLKMRLGGIYDHVGFGFHRYSTDAEWLVPHFEKMLYDQALLIMVYAEAFQATKKAYYERVAREIISYVLRDMTSDQGGFYSAEDADSEGEEGKFYLWSAEEIEAVIDKKETDLYKTVFNVKDDGNYHDEASGKPAKNNILYMDKPLNQFAGEFGISERELSDRIEAGRKKLFISRKQRIHPFKDGKILTDWNGLMIAAFSKAGQMFNEPRFIEAASTAADFILKNLMDTNGRLLKRYRGASTSVTAFINDYTFMVWGLLELYEATFNPKYLKEAIRLTDITLSHFWDETNGGFFMTSSDSEEVIARLKEFHDGAIPSGNSVAAMNLLRLSRITGKDMYATYAEKTVTAFSKVLTSHPAASTQLLSALEFAWFPSYEVVIVGDLEKKDTQVMLAALRRSFVPAKVVLFKSSKNNEPEISKIAPYTSSMGAVNDEATAYVCENFTCKLPTTKIEEMLRFLQPKRE